MNITGPTTLPLPGQRSNIIEPDFVNPAGHPVHLESGAIRWPKIDGVTMTEVPPWLTSYREGVIHLGERPPPFKLVNVFLGNWASPNGGPTDEQLVWQFWRDWCAANPSGTGGQFTAAFAADQTMQGTIYYSGTIGSRILAKAIKSIEGVTDFASFRDWTNDNADAVDIGGVV